MLLLRNKYHLDDMKGKIVDAIEKGYMLGGKVLRYAKVVVANKE